MWVSVDRVKCDDIGYYRVMAPMDSTESIRRWQRRFGYASAVFAVFAATVQLLSVSAVLPPFPDGAESIALMAFRVSVVALAISLAGFVTTSYFAWRADRRAQQEHKWKKAEREAASPPRAPCAPWDDTA